MTIDTELISKWTQFIKVTCKKGKVWLPHDSEKDSGMFSPSPPPFSFHFAFSLSLIRFSSLFFFPSNSLFAPPGLISSFALPLCYNLFLASLPFHCLLRIYSFLLITLYSSSNSSPPPPPPPPPSPLLLLFSLLPSFPLSP